MSTEIQSSVDGQTDHVWERGLHELPFKVGEFTPLTVTFAAVENTTHFTRHPPVSSPSAPEFFHSDPEAGVAVETSRPVLAQLPAYSRQEGGVARYVTWQYERQFVTLGGDFAAYLEGLRGKTRSTLRRKVRKFVEASGSAPYFRAFRSADEIEEFLEAARRVSDVSFQDRLFDEGLPDTEEYARELRRRAAAGEVIGWIAYVDGTAVAYTLGEMEAPGVIIYGYTGYDPEYRSLSPGTVLQYLVIEYLHDETDFEIYDLCVGEGAHKRLFANAEQLCADVLYFRPTLRNRAVVLAHRGLSWLNEATIRALDAIGIKQAVKKFFRRQK